MRYIVAALFFRSLSFSQSKDSIYNKDSKITFSFYSKHDSLSKIKPNFNYKFKANDMPLFSVYYRNSKLNDVYYQSKDSYSYVKTVNLNSNQLVPKDSFNPNATSNFKAGLFMGIANTVFKSFF